MQSQIEELKIRVSAWRAAKKHKGERLPEELRKAIGKVLRSHSDAEVGKALQLQKAILDRCRACGPKKSKSLSLIPLPNPLTVSANLASLSALERGTDPVQIELSNSSGGLLRMRVPAGRIAELGCIVGSFLGGGSR